MNVLQVSSTGPMLFIYKKNKIKKPHTPFSYVGAAQVCASSSGQGTLKKKKFPPFFFLKAQHVLSNMRSHISTKMQLKKK